MKYEEIMNRITVTPEMRQRVLRNVEAARIQKRKRLMGQLTALAACLAIALCGWLVWAAQKRSGAGCDGHSPD